MYHADVPVVKRDFAPQTTLLAPPIIFSSRVQSSIHCPTQCGSSFIQSMNKKGIESHCEAPSKCKRSLFEDDAGVLSCHGNPEERATFFGLDPVRFLTTIGRDTASGPEEEIGYADFLYAITDQDFIFRQDQGNSTFIDTSRFIDSLTQSVKVVLIFFTPRLGLTSILTISADTSSSRNALVWFDVKHYEILDGGRLRGYIAMQSSVLLSILIMFIESTRHLMSAWKRRKSLTNRDSHDQSESLAGAGEREREREIYKAALITVLDFGFGIVVLCYVAIRINGFVESSGVTQDILRGFESIPWSSPSVLAQDKKQLFLKTVSSLQRKIEAQHLNHGFLVGILIVNLLRLIKHIDVHPRLGVLTSTFFKALDDLWHTAILTVGLMISFACIGILSFGSEHKRWSTFESSMRHEFELLFGEFPDDWTDHRTMAIFTIVYLLVLFLGVLNFLLAIIVDAYMNVRQDLQQLEIEQEFLTDVFQSCALGLKGLMHGWPPSAALGDELVSWKARFSVGFHDLNGTGLFRDETAICSFLKTYSRYDFLQPIPVNKFGVSPEYMNEWRVGDSQSDENTMMIRLTKLLEKKLKGERELTLRETLLQAEALVAKRRSSRALSDDGETLLLEEAHTCSALAKRRASRALKDDGDSAVLSLQLQLAQVERELAEGAAYEIKLRHGSNSPSRKSGTNEKGGGGAGAGAGAEKGRGGDGRGGSDTEQIFSQHPHGRSCPSLGHLLSSSTSTRNWVQSVNLRPLPQEFRRRQHTEQEGPGADVRTGTSLWSLPRSHSDPAVSDEETQHILPRSHSMDFQGVA